LVWITTPGSTVILPFYVLRRRRKSKLNRRVDLNLEIKRLEAELAKATTSLGS